MTGLVTASLLAWPVICLMFFSLMKARTAVVISLFFTAMFLPNGSIPISGFIDVNKYTAGSIGVLFGVMLFDSGRVMGFRLRWIDIPLAIFLVTPFFSSVLNGLGVYDGLSTVLGQILWWGVPYFVGRLYFVTPEATRFLAKAIVIAVLIYVPFVLLEIRLSPQLHRWIYGYHAISWDQILRGSGYRPTVFMQHGLMLSLWLASGAFCLYQSKGGRRIAGLPTSLIVIGVGIVVFMCRSFGAFFELIILLLLGFVSQVSRYTIILVLTVSIVPAYVGGRIALNWEPAVAVDLVDQYVSPDRALSLNFRFFHERMIIDKALNRPFFGYGGWGRGRVYSETGEDLSVTDSYWIIVFSSAGLFGLSSFLATLLIPLYMFCYRVRARYWSQSWAAGALAMALIVFAFTLDCLVNAMFNPIYVLVIGGLAGFVVHPSWRQAASRQTSRQMPSNRLRGQLQHRGT